MTTGSKAHIFDFWKRYQTLCSMSVSRQDDLTFKWNITTDDKRWVCSYHQEKKQQIFAAKDLQFPRPDKGCEIRSTTITLLVLLNTSLFPKIALWRQSSTGTCWGVFGVNNPSCGVMACRSPRHCVTQPQQHNCRPSSPPRSWDLALCKFLLFPKIKFKLWGSLFGTI